MEPDDIKAAVSGVVLRDEGGQAKLSTLDWFSALVAITPAVIATFDNTSTPALSAEAGADFDMLRREDFWIVAVATQTELVILDLAANGASADDDKSLSLATLGLSFGTNPRLLSVAMEENFIFNLGHLYASATEDGASGRVIRYLDAPTGTSSLLSTNVMSSMDALGETRVQERAAVRVSVNIASEESSAVRVSAEVE